MIKITLLCLVIANLILSTPIGSRNNSLTSRIFRNNKNQFLLDTHYLKDIYVKSSSKLKRLSMFRAKTDSISSISALVHEVTEKMIKQSILYLKAQTNSLFSNDMNDQNTFLKTTESKIRSYLDGLFFFKIKLYLLVQLPFKTDISHMKNEIMNVLEIANKFLITLKAEKNDLTPIFSEIHGIENGKQTTAIICRNFQTKIPGVLIDNKGFTSTGGFDEACLNYTQYTGFVVSVEDSQNVYCQTVGKHQGIDDLHAAVILYQDNHIIGTYSRESKEAQYTFEGVAHKETDTQKIQIICFVKKD